MQHEGGGGAEQQTAWLSEEYAAILREQDSIRSEFKSRDKSLEYLLGLVQDLFIDWNKLQGADGRQRIGQLRQAFMAGEFDQMVALFLATASSRRK